MGNSLLLNKRRELRQGHVLYSVACNPMMTISGYSNEESYAYGPMCSEELNHIRYGVPRTRNCRDNFALALAPYGFTSDRFPTRLFRLCGWRSSLTEPGRSKSRRAVRATSTTSEPKWIWS